MTLAVVTATVDANRAGACFDSWILHASRPFNLYVVHQGQGNRDWERISRDPRGFQAFGLHRRELLGVVPAFNLGVQRALHDGAEIIACLHDDLEIQQDAWDAAVLTTFKYRPAVGLAGFGGALGLGDEDLYQKPYSPMQLARKTFGSNMRDAEAHGERWESPRQVACLDGFSQIGRREFWEGLVNPRAGITTPRDYKAEQVLDILEQGGIKHHFYDGMLGCFAKRLGWQVWYLPIACHHHGGLTAVADTRYHKWAKQQDPEGDAGFWKQAHAWGYGEFKDVLPIRVLS